MTSSGTYGFSITTSEAVVTAYARIGIRRTALTREHLADAALESNLLLVEWSNLQPLLWRSETLSYPLTEGTATYALPARVVMVLIAYIETGSGTSIQDRVIGPLSTVEYQSIPNKLTQGPPSSFWLDRQIIPEMNLWPAPDDGGPYTLVVQTVSQVQDVELPGGQTLDMPYRFFDAYVSGLASRLARIHAPERLGEAQSEAARTWAIASTNDVENVGFYVLPQIGNYYRGQ